MTKIFVRKPFLVLVTVVIVLVIGAVSLRKLQTDLLPQMELPYIMVIVTEPGASPDEVEADVVEPLESSLGTVSGVENVLSTSSNNYGLVTLEFGSDTDMNSALVRVSQAVDTIEFPEGCGTPNLMEIGMDMMASMYANVNYEGMELSELTNFTNEIVKPYLEKQEGVASIATAGGIETTVEVRLDEDKIKDVNKRILAHTNEELSDAQEEIDDGKSKLSDAKSELKEKQEELSDSESETYEKIADGQVALSSAQATKAAYQANLTALKANQSALKGEKQAYEDAKIEETYESLDAMFETFETQLGAVADAAGIEIPSSVEDAVNDTKKFTKFKTWLTSIGYGDQVKDITVSSLKQVYNVVKVRIPQIDTELANLKIEIKAAKAMIKALNKQIKNLDETQSETIAGGYSAASGFGSGSAQLANALSDLESSEQSLEDAQDQLDDSMEAAIENSNLDALLDLETLSNLITAQNFSMPAGYISDEDDTQWLVQVGDEYETPEDLQEMVLTKIKGVGTIKMSDVAAVTVVETGDESYTKVNGEDALMLMAYKTSTASTTTVTNQLLDSFDKLEQDYDGLSFTVMMNQGDYINTIVKSVLSSILLGAILAVVVLVLFLKDVRPTLVVAFSIPFSVLFALIVMYFTNLTLNVMTLAGLCIGIGMLVDNSVVVMENVYRLRGQGYPSPKAAVYGTKQVAGSIIASTITTICVFLPMVFTTGYIADLLMPFAFTISYALIASLLVSVTIVPAMGTVLLRKPRDIKHPLLDRIQDAYGKALSFCLRKKVVPLAIAIVLFVLCGSRVASTGLSMLDDMESNQITGSMTMKEDTSDEDAIALADQASELILQVDGVDKVSVLDGSAQSDSMVAGAAAEADYSSFVFYVITDEGITKTKEYRKILKDIRAKVADLDCEEFTVESSAMGSASSLMSSGVEVKIYGDEQEQLIAISEDVMKIMADVNGLEEIDNGVAEDDKEIHLTIDKDKAAKKGLTVATIYQQIAAAITTEQDSITMDIDDTDVDVKIIDESDELTYENLLDCEITATVTNTDGTTEEKTYKLSDFATTKEGYAMSSINRDNQEKYLSVTASVSDDYNATRLSEKVESLLASYDTPDGYKIEMAGEMEEVMDMVRQLVYAIALGFLLIYLVMVAQFQSLMSPFIVIFTVPLAFTGGMIGLIIFGMNITAMSLMGFMILMGTVVNNGIVFVDYANRLRGNGVEKRQALVITGKVRMRPIIMTALTTILSLSVMVFSQDAGNAMQKGMAIVVCFGLLYGTLMTLFIVPVLYDIFYRRPPRYVDVKMDLNEIEDETAQVVAEYGIDATRGETGNQ
ncbi:efflux RND transporter permease subunit [Eubacterium oxidoreducens]|uniref:Multidrug efflux pump subunit AcrB n=1 Tax=Eubacterium oxidoreducens TaxID=1732 RepID=A0A1G6B4W6_EUBOX|nr:efflux RND transporter permease subunit [Eubacterium oxidoreducens]SDB15698.1 Multidrug efflux pump subunit AcrB [Eubacterium oxidoreducens]